MNTNETTPTLTADETALVIIALRHLTHTNERRSFDDRRSPAAIRRECAQLRHIVARLENTNR